MKYRKFLYWLSFSLFFSLTCEAAGSTVKIDGVMYTILSSDINGDNLVDFYFKANPVMIFIPNDDDLVPISVPRMSYVAISNANRTYNIYSTLNQPTRLSSNWNEGKYSGSSTGVSYQVSINPLSVYDSGPFTLTLSSYGNTFASTITMPPPVLEHFDGPTTVFPMINIQYALPPPTSLPSTSTPSIYSPRSTDSRH